MKHFLRRIPREIQPEKEEELRQEPLEKADWPAMLAAAFVTIFLPILLILLLFGGFCYLLVVGF